MHRIECPKCHTKYKVAAPKAQAQVQCAKCGNIFIASSVEVSDSAADKLASSVAQLAGEGGHVERTGYRRPVVQTRGAPWMVISAVVAALAAIGLLVWLIVSWEDVNVTVGDEKVVTLSKKEAKERQVEEEAKRKAAAKAAAEARAAGPATPAGATPGMRPVPPPKLPTGDANVNTDGAQIVPRAALPGAGHVFGQARNDYPGGSADIKLMCWLVTKDNRVNRLAPVILRAVPTGTNVHFSFDFHGMDEADMDALKAHVWAEAAHHPNMLAWKLDAERAGGGGGKSIWTGRAVNPFAKEVKDVKIVCDFYEVYSQHQWRYAGTITDTLKYATDLPPGKSERFELEFKAGIKAERANAVECRAVGTVR